MSKQAYESALSAISVPSLLTSGSFLPESSDFLDSGLKQRSGRARIFVNLAVFAVFVCFRVFPGLDHSGLLLILLAIIDSSGHN